MEDESVITRFQDGLIWVIVRFGITDRILINSIDFGVATTSTGEDYSPVFHQIMVDQHTAPISGTTKPSISRQGGVLYALETLEHFAGIASGLSVVKYSRGLAGEVVFAFEEARSKDWNGRSSERPDDELLESQGQAE